MCYFFRIYLDFFSFFFCPLFHFHWKESSKSAERKALSSVLERRGERDEERRADEVAWVNEEEEKDRGLSFSLLPLSLSISVVRLSGIRVLCVKFLLLVWLLVGDSGLFGFLQCVAALILLLHPVHKQHHEEGSKQGAHYSSHYHRWWQTETES